MRCRCCDRLLTDAESKARDSRDRSKFLDLCNICRYKSNPYNYSDDDDGEVLNKEDINVDYG
jgi:hypothetical protein